MNHCERAVELHHRGFNCCQSVLTSLSDLTGLPEQTGFDAVAGFGLGLQTGEICGAVTGAAMALGLLTPVDPEDPVTSKQRTGALVKELQERFREKFGNLRCAPLLETEIAADDRTPAARDLGLTARCDILIASAVEIVEEMRRERA